MADRQSKRGSVAAVNVRRPLSPPVDATKRWQAPNAPELLSHPWAESPLLGRVDVLLGERITIVEETKTFAPQESGPHYVASNTLPHIACDFASAKKSLNAKSKTPTVPGLQADRTTASRSPTKSISLVASETS